MINLRAISWLKGARRDFEEFPTSVRIDVETALSIAARGGKADTAKPFKGVDGGVFEIALKDRGNAYRVIYAVQIGVAPLGHRRFSEEIEDWNQNAQGRR